MSLGGARKTLVTAWFRVALEEQQDHRVFGGLEGWGLRLPVSRHRRGASAGCRRPWAMEGKSIGSGQAHSDTILKTDSVSPACEK